MLWLFTTHKRSNIARATLFSELTTPQLDKYDFIVYKNNIITTSIQYFVVYIIALPLIIFDFNV